jgi:hydrogenase nickel incorporation protein HypA/HybF
LLGLNIHELNIAEAVLKAVQTEALRYPGSFPRKVGVRVGELAAVDPEALRFCFDAIIRETDLGSLQLEVEVCPLRHRCQDCGQEFIVRDYDFCCPQCGSERSVCISGDELGLAYLEVEEYEPSADGAERS